MTTASSAPPTRQVITRQVRYHADGARLLAHLADRGLVPTTALDATPASAAPNGTAPARRPLDTVLLESVDITTKVSRTTVAVLQASARLTCTGQEVTVEALPGASADGADAIAHLRRELAGFVVGSPAGPASGQDAALARLTLRFPEPGDSALLEERERLTAPANTDPLRVLADRAVDHPHLPLEAGVVAFDHLATFETLPEVPTGANTCPDYLFYDARVILVVDHPTRSATLVGASVDPADLAAHLAALATAIDALDPEPDPAPEAAAPQTVTPPAPPEDQPVLHARPTVSDASFAAMVERMKESIAAGDVYQVVPSRGFTLPCPDAVAAYGQLRRSNPSPYMFYLAAPGFELFGASPESALLHSAAAGEVAIRPIAGTRPRGLGPDGSVDHELDTRLELELRTDAKEVAEHVMLVDLARNDVARVAVPGTRRVRDLLRVDRYSRVMHLVSEVSGTLAPDLHPLDAFRASMTMGTLTGAPKLRAAELIREAEGVRRGSYGGSVGYLRGDGELDTCIVIRSAFVTGGQALVQAGAGVVAHSVPAKEAAETVHKASAVLVAVAAAAGARLVIDSGDDAPPPSGTSGCSPAGPSSTSTVAASPAPTSPAPTSPTREEA